MTSIIEDAQKYVLKLPSGLEHSHHDREQNLAKAVCLHTQFTGKACRSKAPFTFYRSKLTKSSCKCLLANRPWYSMGKIDFAGKLYAI